MIRHIVTAAGEICLRLKSHIEEGVQLAASGIERPWLFF